MTVNGCNCSMVVKTACGEMGVPYAEETLREAVSLLEEEACIEGDGVCRAIRKNGGAAGCIITPLTIGTAQLLLCLAMGAVGKPVFVSETRNLYRYSIHLLPMEDAERFDLLQMRSEQSAMRNERRLYEGCRVKGFELRIMREEAIKLKLEITSERPPVTYQSTAICTCEKGEHFSGDYVTYKINGQEFKNIYGATLSSKKEGGTKTALWIKRALHVGNDLPHIIDEMIITAQLLRDTYEMRHYGIFRVTLKRLVLASDETNINSSDTVIGPLRYYVADTVSTEVFSSGIEAIA